MNLLVYSMYFPFRSTYRPTVVPQQSITSIRLEACASKRGPGVNSTESPWGS